MEDRGRTVEGVVTRAEFWSGRRVLLTGHTGFKGAWLALWLRQLGAEVTGISLAPRDQRALFVSAGVSEDLSSNLYIDVREYGAIREAVEQARPQVVLHLAAQPLVRRSYADPLETFSTNVMGTAHVLEALRPLADVEAVLVVTSDKCYENREWPWGYREIEPLGGSDPYSASKACQEHVAAAYRHSFFGREGSTILATARAGNVIGGGDWSEDRLVPDVIAALRAGQPVSVRNADAVRPWQHVLEALSGYLTLVERMATAEVSEAYNFGPEKEAEPWPVSRVVDYLTTRWGDGATWRSDGSMQPPEAHALEVDSSRARHELGWRTRLSTARALEWTLDWYRAQAAGQDVRTVTLEQLAQYRRLDGAEERAIDGTPIPVLRT